MLGMSRMLAVKYYPITDPHSFLKYIDTYQIIFRFLYYCVEKNRFRSNAY